MCQVPTAEALRVVRLVGRLFTVQRHVLLLGAAGVGKSCVLRYFVDSLPSGINRVKQRFNGSTEVGLVTRSWLKRLVGVRVYTYPHLINPFFTCLIHRVCLWLRLMYTILT